MSRVSHSVLAAWRPIASQPGLEVKIDEDKYIEVDEVVKGENEHFSNSKWELNH